MFGAACQQSLRLDSLSDRSIWVYPPEEFIGYLLDLVCFTLEDCPNNEFFNTASPFLPLNVCGAFQLCKQSSIVEKHPFSNALFQGMDDNWHSSIAVSLSGNPANLITIQDSGSHEPSDASQVPNCVSMDSNQGTTDLPKIPTVLNLMGTHASYLQWLTGAMLVLVPSIQYSLIQILPPLQATLCN